MKRKVLYGILGGIMFLMVGTVLGLITGMNVGGNYYPTFEWGGARGYEATGQVGAMIGGLVGLVGGILVGMYVAKRRKDV